MTWMTRMDGFVNKNAHIFLIKKMKTNSYDNPMMVHEVQSDFVRPKENFGINSKMFRSDASVSFSKDAPFGINKDTSNSFVTSKGISKGKKYECEFDEWSPNESMR